MAEIELKSRETQGNTNPKETIRNNKIKLNINGIEIEVDEGKTILQAVRENQLDDIPTLCYEEGLGAIASCFLCVVEVEGARGLLPSCSTKVTPGMKIKTRTPQVMEARKMCLELLFSDHYADCISPCALRCPAGVDIQGYLLLVKQGLYREAIELIKERNPLPIVCGRVCVRECEVGCRRNVADQPVGIDYLKRYAAESVEGRSFTPKIKPARGKSVGIVGGGPAGLSAAYYLAVEGYKVTIYEGMPHPGGMLRYGIPAYRLPKALLDSEIDSIRKLGVDILCDKKLGRDFTLTDLKANHDAVLLAMGAWGSMSMRVENENTPGVLSGIEVLRQVIEGKLKELRGRVLVIGGGNTAIDACRTAKRLGADEVVVLYRRTESEMPAHHEEIEGAREEGVLFNFLVAPTKVVTDKDGKLTGLECLRMELGEPDASGRPRPIPVKGSNYVEPADYIISAIGQSTQLQGLFESEKGEEIKLTRWGTVSVNEKTMETHIPGVFSAGDVVSGPATAIEGIAGGRRSAFAIHNYLSGEHVKVDIKEFSVNKDMFGRMTCEDLPCMDCSPRHAMPQRDPLERIRDFDEVELGLSRDEIFQEAGRCLQCGCLEVDECLLRKYGEEYGVNPAHYLGEVNRYDIDKRHPFILIDANKCIQCGRCIKTCEGILSASALGFVNRGFSTVIAPSMQKALIDTNCISCGNCIDTCPTGALSENLPLLARIGDKVQDHPGVCSFCGVGCNINVKTFGRDMRIRSLRNKITGEGDYLCRRGRFGSRYLNSSDRLLQPLLRQEGRTRYTHWDSALKETADKFKEIKDKYRRDSIGVFISPKLTNEEIYTAVRFARESLDTDIMGSYRDLFHCRDHHEIDPILGHTVSTNSMDDVLSADVILLINSDPMESHPSFGWKIRKAWRQGTKIVVINSNRIDPVRHADLWLQPRRGTATYVINGIMNHILTIEGENKEFINNRTVGIEGIKNFLKDFTPEAMAPVTGVLADKMKKTAQLITEGNPKVMVIYDFDNPLDRATGDLSAIADLLLLTGNLGEKARGLLLLQKHSNSVGLYDMGGEPGYLPGRISLKDEKARQNLEKIWNTPLPTYSKKNIPELFLSGKVKGLLVIGEDPLENPADSRYLRSLEFMAVMDIFPTETERCADVVLPCSTYMESGGSYTRMDRKIQHFSSAFPSPTGKTNLEILAELSQLMGHPLPFQTPEEVFTEIKKVNPLYSPLTTRREKGENLPQYWCPQCCDSDGTFLYCCRFYTDDGKARFSAYGMENTTYPYDDFDYQIIESRYNRWIKKLFLKKRLEVGI